MQISTQTWRRALAGLACAMVLTQPAAWAQGQVTRLLVGYAAGGPVDLAARQFAPALERELGHTVVVENRPGAAGSLAGDVVARAAANGRTLYFAASPTLTISPFVLKSMTFDPAKDLSPVAPVLTYANALVINHDLLITNIAELIGYAKANPGKLSYGSAGMGASNHLSGELFARQAEVQLMHVPYRGNAPAMADVMGGQVAMMFDILSTARSYTESGRVRALAVTSGERNASMPDVPTMREAGLPGYEVIGWFGLYGPAGLDAATVQALNGAAVRALTDQKLQATWQEQGYDVWSGSPQELAAQQSRDFALWRDVTKDMAFD